MVKPQARGNQPAAGHNGHGPGPFSFLNVPGAGQSLSDRARRVRLLLTDCDGVLTDGAVYYSARGEELKRFSIRDGMGVERLRELVGVEVGIISGEESPSLRRRAEKLGIDELHLGVKDKLAEPEVLAVLPVHLVAVHDEDALSRVRMLHDQRFFGHQSVPLWRPPRGVDNLVVAKDQMEALQAVEGMEQVEDLAMRTANLGEAVDSPQIVAIAHLDVGEAFFEIMSQGTNEQRLVHREWIGLAVVASMQIAKEHKPGGIVEGYGQRGCESGTQALVGAGPLSMAIKSGG